MLIIHNLDTGFSYTVNKPQEAKDKTDKSAAETAMSLRDTITMGKIIVEYKPCTY